MEVNWRLAKKRPVLEQRARILQQIRAFFSSNNFLEVDTPHRIPANAPEFYIDAVASEGWFLHTSPELCMKRLLAAGYERIFQICHCWRAGEEGHKHLPEYNMLEWYRCHCDYHQLMQDCEDLICRLCENRLLHWQGQPIDLTPPWPRLTLSEAFSRYSPVPLRTALANNQFDLIIDRDIEPQLPADRPLFLYDYPLEQASLARRKPGSPDVAERVELYIGGLELANGFSELNDQNEQRQRFEQEEKLRRQAGKTPYPTPQKFLDELAQLPPSAGIALGIDRLVMLMSDTHQIEDVVSFTPGDL
ncbi:MAG: EF-P lysine aminoacylase GenX [Desulfuromonadales bacterium]|nr:EF-P lysine aminoacylase GenX [Desulfuromonadales bacterium]MBN2791777.1 EF-P lysine aminoacylase GenX [Desulfuromonadales bacterium]